MRGWGLVPFVVSCALHYGGEVLCVHIVVWGRQV